MPIRPYLDGHPFDPETVRLLGLAFEMASAALKIEASDDPANRALADKLIALANHGERDPDRLAERVASLRAPEWASCPTMWPSAQVSGGIIPNPPSDMPTLAFQAFDKGRS